MFVNQNGISGTFAPSTGLLTLTGTATAAQYQAALRSVTFTTNAQNPSTVPRTISFSASDGTDASPPVSRAMNVVSVNDVLILAPAVARPRSPRTARRSRSRPRSRQAMSTT